MKKHRRSIDVVALKRKLRAGRSRLGISQREACERARISKSVLEKYESRLSDRVPSTRQLFALAQVYDLSVDFLLGLTATNNGDPR